MTPDSSRVVLRSLALGLALSASARLVAAAQAPPGAAASALPVVEVPADTGHTLALLLSGDGGWAGGDRAVATALARGGVAVVGLDMRAYLRGARRNPDALARDAASIVQQYADRWHRDRIVVVGYSRGANLAPFAVSRWPAPLRHRLALVALVGPTDFAGFEFHWEDMLHVVRRPTDLPMRPELERLRGTAMLCISGEDEKGSICPTLDPSLVRATRHAGGHVLDGRSGAAVAEIVLASLR